MITCRLLHTAHHGLDNLGWLKRMRAGHEQRAEAQLEPLEPFGGGVLHRLGGDAFARVEVNQRPDRAVVALQVSHKVRDRPIQLDHRARLVLGATSTARDASVLLGGHRHGTGPRLNWRGPGVGPPRACHPYRSRPPRHREPSRRISRSG